MRKSILPRLPSVAPLCFFLISVSYKLAWTAISSLLSQYSKIYGPGILLQLNVAYFFPSIPILMLQAVFNDRMDRRLGLPTGALLRLTTGLGALVALTTFFPMLTAGSERALLSMTVLVGMSYGVAFGTSYQIASKYPSGATVALTTGFVSSGPVVLLFDLALKRGPYYTPEGLEQLFRWVAIVTALGLLAAVALVLGSWRMLSALPPQRVEIMAPYKGGPSAYGNLGAGSTYGVHASERTGGGPYVRHRSDTAMFGTGVDGGGAPAASGPLGSSSMGSTANGGYHGPHMSGHSAHPAGGPYQQQSHHAITFDFSGDVSHQVPHNGSSGGTEARGYHGPHGYHVDVAVSATQAGLSGDESKVAKKDLPLLQLAGRILPAATAIAISVGTSMLIFPFFTYMYSTGLLGVRLPQVLFYVRLVGDILGRMVPKRLQVTSVRRLMLWAAVKLAMVPVLFGCIFTPELLGGDITSIVVVALFWVLSGYLNTCSYLVAPQLVPPGQKGRASSLMTVAFQSACFGALMLAYAVQQLKLAHDGHGGVAAAAVGAAVVGGVTH